MPVGGALVGLGCEQARVQSSFMTTRVPQGLSYRIFGSAAERREPVTDKRDDRSPVLPYVPSRQCQHRTSRAWSSSEARRVFLCSAQDETKQEEQLECTFLELTQSQFHTH